MVKKVDLEGEWCVVVLWNFKKVIGIVSRSEVWKRTIDITMPLK